jgi:iron(III) transport system substrate-binding protein
LRRTATALALAGLSVIALAACSPTQPAEQSVAGSTSKAAAVEPLVLYAAEGYDAVTAKAFTAKTHIPVKVVDDSTGPLLTKIAAERSNPQWSLLWVDGDQAFASLDQQGELLPYRSLAPMTSVGKSLVPADGSYTPTATTVMAAVIYNAARVSSVPSSYTDLLRPAYRGKVGMNDPSQSGPTYPFIAGLMNQLGGTSGGIAQGEAYFTKLKQNGLRVFPTNGDTLHALETGQIDYGMVQSSAAIGETLTVKATSKFKPKLVYLPKSTLLPSVLGIDKQLDPVRQAEAKKFVDYALSVEGQRVMQTGDTSGDSLFWPLVPGVNALAGMPDFPTAYQVLDPKFWGTNEPQIVTWFYQSIK